VKSEEYWLE
jgi:hypothetical protein